MVEAIKFDGRLIIRRAAGDTTVPAQTEADVILANCFKWLVNETAKRGHKGERFAALELASSFLRGRVLWLRVNSSLWMALRGPDILTGEDGIVPLMATLEMTDDDYTELREYLALDPATRLPDYGLKPSGLVIGSALGPDWIGS